MSELAIVAVVCAAGLPLTALITGLVCKAVADRAFKHVAETQVVGGVPRTAYEQKTEVEVEAKRQQIEARKPKSIRGVF